MADMSELRVPQMPTYDIEEMSPLLDSSDIMPTDWGKIVTIIAKNYFNYDGFVVICGTDTMAYVASALSFMLESNKTFLLLLFQTNQISGFMFCYARNI